MRRRITIAIVGTVAATLLIAGLGTLVFARVGAKQHTVSQLRAQVVDITSAAEQGAFGNLGGANPSSQPQRRLLTVLRTVLRLDGAEVLIVGPRGATAGQLPAGISANDIDLQRLAAGQVISGSKGDLVFAAGAFTRGQSTVVIVVTRRTGVELGAAARWFLLAAAITLAVGATVAARLSRSLTEPLREADAASRRIATGDLAVRLPQPPDSATDELADLARSINSMAGTLERSKGLEQQFLLSISHDLRTPLTSIQGYAEAIADGATSDVPHAAAVIQTEARRLARLVSDLLALAKLDAHQFNLDLQPIDVTEVVAGTVDGFGPEAQAAELIVRTEASGPVPAIADVDRLAQVVANLVENAMAYAASEVVVRVAATPTGALITVEDDGPGIASEDLPHVFERLYVSKAQPRRRESGSGLGLAIVRELVLAMGGDVGAEQGATGGAHLTVTLRR
jgi:two-component system sensor histidine kinase BaeS